MSEIKKCICGGIIEDLETENGNIVSICMVCGCPYDCQPIKKDECIDKNR